MNSLEVYSEKLPYVRKHPAGAYVPEQLTFLECWDMPILEKVDFPYIWDVNGTWMVHEWYVDGT